MINISPNVATYKAFLAFPQPVGFWFQENSIVIVCCLPLLTAVILVIIPDTFFLQIRGFVMCSSIVTCFWSQYRLIYTPFILGPAVANYYPWLVSEDPTGQIHIAFALGVDGISLFFILLTTSIFPFCFLSIYKKVEGLKMYCFCFLVLESFLLFAFSVSDLFFFLCFF